MKKWLKNFSVTGISLELDDGVLVIRYGENIYDIFFDTGARDCYINLLDAIDNDPEVKAVLSLNKHGCLGEGPYEEHIKKLSGINNPINFGTSLKYLESSKRTRQLCFHHYTISKRLASKKLIVDGLQGTVVTPFFGEALSADIRLVSEDFQFSLAHKKYGIHPTGGLAFFLPRFVGQGRASEILLMSDVIDAHSALKEGLVSQILPNSKFETRCILATKELIKLSQSTIETTKKLLFRDEKDLHDYFEQETRWIFW